jgi:hypothetical protein
MGRQFKPGQLQTGSLYNISSSYAVTASYAENAGVSIDTGSLVTTASFNAFTASYGTGSFTGSFTGLLTGTASWANNSVTASYVQTAQTASYVLNAVSASYVNSLHQQIILSGSLKLDPTQDPDPLGSDLDSTTLFQSSSNTSLGYDLYVRQNGNLVKWKWIEGSLETGLLYGGVVTYSGSNVFISPGSGIIAEHNATTGSEVSPMIEYVTWNAITQSITNIATQQVTYLYIDNTGTLQQQSTRFTSQQYHSYIPLGAVGHFDYTQVSAFGGGVQTAYDQISQISNFVDAFGPLKISGYGLTGQASSLRLSVGAGTSFIHGGFYQNDPEFPSQITTPSQATASLARINRSGSVIEFDTNAGNLYTAVDPTKYDRDGDGTLANVGNGNWSIQRVFIDPKTGVLYVYYGQARYTSLLNALQYLPTDPFTEGDTFDFTTFERLKGNASDITDTAANSIINGGLFRGSGQGSGGGIALSNLDDLTDVSIVSPTNGQALVYNAGIWQNGVPTSSSYALTASYLDNYIPPFPFTGSARITGSLSVTGSFSVYNQNANYAVLDTNTGTFRGTNTSSSIDWIGRVLNNTSGQEVLSWRTLRAKDSNTSQSIDWGNRRLTDNYGIVSADWSFGRRLLYDQYTSSSIDWENRATYDANGNRSVFWNNRYLYNSSGTVVVDWENQTNYDAANSVSIDWNSRQLIDSSGNASVDWEGKQLTDTSSNEILFWDAVNNNYKIGQSGFKEDYINLQHQENLSQAASDNERLNPAGESIIVGLNIDPTVATGDLVSLGEDGIWYQTDQASSSGSAMLGICLNGYNKGQVFTEGTMTVVTGSGYTDIPFIDGTSFYGKPVYMRNGVLGGLTTTPPTSGYIRIVGYLYYNNTTVTDYWLMKFRPSNDWYVI